MDVKVIKKYDLSTGAESTVFTNLTRGIALDYDARTGRLFFTDVTRNIIYSSVLNGTSKVVTEVSIYLTVTKIEKTTGKQVP